MRHTITEPVDDFLAAIERGATHRAIDLALQRFEDGGIPGVIDGLLAPAQREAGERWQLARYTVTQEHMATGVVDDVLGLLSARTAIAGENPNTLALVCSEGEWHGTPARMAALLARDAGWRVRFLGASTPPEHLRTSLRDMTPQALGVSCTLPLALAGVPPVTDIAGELGVPVVLGGRAVGSDGRYATRLGADGAFADMSAAIRTLEGWLDAPPTTVHAPIDDDLARQRSVLISRRADIVARTFAALDHRLAVMATFDEPQRRHTWRDLDYIVRFADVALLVDDPGLFTGFMTWLTDLLAARGVSPAVMLDSLEILREVLGGELLGGELPAVDLLLTDAIEAIHGHPAGIAP